MAHGVILGLHIAAGILGLVLGPLALARAARSRRALTAYQLAVVGVCATALALVAMDWSGLWPFALLALATGAAVLAGRRARQGARFIRLTGGSYISLVTALLVVSWGSVAAWVLPTLIGAPVVERAAARADRADRKAPGPLLVQP
jgi:hypothetical protein